MGHKLLRLCNISLWVFLLPLLQGLEISDPGQVVYREARISGVVEHEVTLQCGTTLPDVYIWSFTKPGTDTIRAVVYNVGKGAKLQQLAKDLGDLNVITNSASLSIEKLPLAAEGLYTCQALYDTVGGARLYYYYVYLRVLVPVSKPYILLNNSSAVEGSSYLMECGLDNGTEPITYIWELESRSGLVTTVAENDSSLINIWVNRNHTGWYRCLAKNDVNQERSDQIWLEVLFGPDLPQIDATVYSMTAQGFSALEYGNVSVICQASSNPPSQYLWFYNNSEIYAGPQLTINRILRVQKGDYACVAQNTNLNTRSKKIITLSVYYPPDGAPSCSIFPANNYSDLALFCSWDGGFPPATLKWSPNGDRREGIANITMIQSGPDTANNSEFICHGSHVALNVPQNCSTKTWLPYGQPQCSANSSHNNEYLVLSCSWEGGFPRPLLLWVSGSGDIQGISEENSNILVLTLPSSANYSGKAFVCHAKHPLVKQSKQCVLKLEAPVLTTQRSVVSVYEGNDVQLTCILSKNYPTVREITWYNNLKQNVGDMPKKYVLQQTAAWSNLTVRETDSMTDSGQYWCSAANAVGGAKILILLLVNKYPVPPNVTISKVMYSSRQRADVNVEWTIQTGADLTGFFIERQRLNVPVVKSDPVWEKIAMVLDSSARSYQINSLDPAGTYAFRITAVNHRTSGNPSEIKNPVSMPVSKPHIFLSDTSPVEGTSVRMSCGLENGTDPIIYIWELESQNGLIATLAESNNSLFNIIWVTHNHTGWYRCLARNEVNQERSDWIWLDVLYGPDMPQVDISPKAVMERGFSAVEKGNISLLCQASSNPPSQYVWFYNNSQIYTASQLTMIKIQRTQTGNYTCLAQNTLLSTFSKKTISLNVFYPPDGSPLCTMSPTNNYTDLALFCSWVGGNPPATLTWTPYVKGDNREGISNITLIQSGPDTANNSVFICQGSHIAESSPKTCSTRTWLPYGEPKCFADSSQNNQQLILSCSWEGGFPHSLLWWASSLGNVHGTASEKNNFLVLPSKANYSGITFTCYAKHPLAKDTRQCVLKMETPAFMIQQNVVSVLEGSDAQLSCILNKSYPVVTEIIWYNNMKQILGDNLKKHVIHQTAGRSGLTIRETDGMLDSGNYWCSAINAVGGAEIPIMLLVIMPISKPYVQLSDPSPKEGSSVWMRCDVEKGTLPISYLWEQESRNGLVTTMSKWNSSMINITLVTRNLTGWYRCLGKNEVNQERSDRFWLDVLYGPDFPQISATAYSTTQQGFSALEQGTVSLMCQAPSNPPSQYIWFYNSSEIYSGPQLTVSKVLRVQTGYYACMAQNTILNTRSKKTVTLTVYYPPEGAPYCSIFPVNNYTDLALFCSWEGGFPAARLKWSLNPNGDKLQGISNTTWIQSGLDTSNNSVFTCHGSHIALNTTQNCSTRTWMPYGEPQCLAYVTRNNEYLMLSCSWEGGFPHALLWWASSSGDIQGTSEENSNILVLHSSGSYSGKAFVCHARHPLAKDEKLCELKLEAPVLMTQRSVVSVYEGNDVQLTCILSKNYPAVTEITWYNNMKQNVEDEPRKYILQQAASWSNLTVRETDSMADTGQYWCSAANAVGGAEIPILLLVKRYPMPPNVTISKLIYSSHQRTDVNMEWQVQTDADLTGFFIERQRLPVPQGKSDIVPLWEKIAVDLVYSTRYYQINNLDPTGTYAFRITAVNRRTIGHPSVAKRPAKPPFRAYPAVIGAAIGGMLIAAISTVLLFMYVLRNRNNIPRLHDMIFGRQNTLSTENINFPEDEVAGGTEEATAQGTNGGIFQSQLK